MSEPKTWMDDLLEQVAAGKMLPQEALNRFFLHKRESEQTALTAEDHAFLTAMDAAETAQVVAKWCARNAAAQGGAAAITVDLRRPGLLHPRRHPPRVTGLGLSGRKMMLFTPDGAGQGGEYGEDCLRVSGSFSGAWGDAVFLPVFTSALKTALTAHGLPAPEYLT